MWHKKRLPFHKLGYNPNHIPVQNNYLKQRKPKLDQWENPQFNWPPKLPRPTMHSGKTLLNQLDRDEKLKIIKTRNFEIPDFRTGDVLEFNILTSKSEKIERKLSGICYQKKAPNSIRGKATINFNEEATNISYSVPLYSPMMTNFAI